MEEQMLWCKSCREVEIHLVSIPILARKKARCSACSTYRSIGYFIPMTAYERPRKNPTSKPLKQLNRYPTDVVPWYLQRVY